ncbi:MAG TPA: bacteriohemerythrin [Patescibacteria group bacterium]|nr:bacteriohemerythrin [Patescibacteria group bacterium]
MKRFKWSDKLKVDIKELDEHHETILEHLNNIFDTAEAKNLSEVMIRTNCLIDYWKVHFKYEEELMRHHKYHEDDKHKSDHEDIRSKLSNIKEMHVTGSTDQIPSIVALLNFWEEGHIKSDDMQLGRFLKKNRQ